MTATAPPTLTPTPLPAPQRGDRATFRDRVDAFITWLAASVPQFAALEANVYANALDAAGSATSATASAAAAAASATAAAVSANATAWVSGTTYAAGDCRYSPVDFGTYRRRTAGAGTTDPSADAANWKLISSAPIRAALDKGNSGTTAQVLDYDVADVFQITVTGAFTLSVTNLPASKPAEMRLDLVNGAAFNITWGTTITWEKVDGSFTTSFSSSGYTLQASGRNFIVLWNFNGSGPLYGKVI